MKVEIMGKELIKPASATSHHLRTILLPVSGHLVPPIYVASILFYNTEDKIVSSTLKKSLSRTLTRFYPLAGRIQGASIICNDEGAVFTEARADYLLSDFLTNPDLDSLEQFLPPHSTMSGEPPEKWPLLNVKVSFFRSGGIAVAICVSHKVCDAASLAAFVHGWNATAKGYADTASPEFRAPAFFPAPDPSSQSPLNGECFDVGRLCVKRRFVFEASKIAELKSRVASVSVPNPTRVESISALIWRCARKASGSNSGTLLRPLVMMQAMDLRRRIPSTHFSQNTIGNFVFAFMLKAGPENEMEIREIVTESRKAKEGVNEMIRENLQGNRTAVTLGEQMAKAMVNYAAELMPEMDVHNVTSWCGMTFYEADFGWGSPVWVAPGSLFPVKTNDVGTILMDSKDGEGIEAWVSLLEQDMFVFEHDHELLAFATPNPSVLI